MRHSYLVPNLRRSAWVSAARSCGDMVHHGYKTTVETHEAIDEMVPADRWPDQNKRHHATLEPLLRECNEIMGDSENVLCEAQDATNAALYDVDHAKDAIHAPCWESGEAILAEMKREASDRVAAKNGPDDRSPGHRRD